MKSKVWWKGTTLVFEPVLKERKRPKDAVRAVKSRVPRYKSEGAVKDKMSWRCFARAVFSPEKIEDQDSGNLTLNHPPVKPDPDLVSQILRQFHEPLTVARGFHANQH